MNKKSGNIRGQSRITTNYQVTLPKQIREKLNARIGDIIVFTDDGKNINIRMVKIS